MSAAVAAQTFRAKVVKVGINPAVAVPARVSRAMGRRGYVPVKGRLQDFPIRATLVPIGGGRHRLYLNTEMRKGAGVGAGDTVRLALAIDSAPREIPIPRALAPALHRHPAAASAFAALPPSHRRDYLLYLNWLKTPEALERNVRKVIAHLLRSPRRIPGRGSPLARPGGSYGRAPETTPRRRR